MVLNIFDIGIILLCFMFFIVGFKNGVIKEVFSLVGTVVVFAISFIFKGMIGNIMCLAFPFFEFSGSLEGITSFNILLYQIIAFMAIFCICIINGNIWNNSKSCKFNSNINTCIKNIRRNSCHNKRICYYVCRILIINDSIKES